MAHSGQFSKSQYYEHMKDMTKGLMDVNSDEITAYTCESDWYLACQNAKESVE